MRRTSRYHTRRRAAIGGVVVTSTSVEAIAQRVAEILRDPPPQAAGPFVDAAELARMLGVSRRTVYQRAGELGAIRVGTGNRPRLRFDPTCATAPRQPARPAEAPRRPSRRTRTAHATSRVELLPLRPEPARRERR
jgi:hypothetical protein